MKLSIPDLVACVTAVLYLGTNAKAFADVEDNTHYEHFVAHNKTWTCSADSHATPFNNQIRGVNLGGWLVLEPWITPSLFYQFLGGDENTTALDIYSFCEVLGPEEGNKQLRRHWDTWVTEDIIESLASSGAVNSLRLPVGDWMYKPYGPYIGCTDGALDYVDYLLDWAHSRGISVLIDIHGVKGSQNGFDNSGQCQGMEWTSQLNTEPAGLVTFEHWPIRSANWMGDFDRETTSYTNINYKQIQHALDTIQVIVDKYKNHPAVLGLEPVNEPWQFTPLKELKKFYWEGYLIVKNLAPYWKYIIHDSFRFDPETWGGFMRGCPDRALDTHIYQAWKNPAARTFFYEDACQQKQMIVTMEKAFGPIIVGEWSLATDNCAMWLNGFNDNLPGFPRLPCKYVECAKPYMGPEQPGTPLDPSKPIQGPYGTGMSGPIFGLCPVGRDWLKETHREDTSDWMRAPPEASNHQDASDEVMTNLARRKISTFSGFGHGFYFWNFRTELDEPDWSYMLALEKGWIPKGNLNDPNIVDACYKEDTGAYKCVARRGQLEINIQHSIKFTLNADYPGEDQQFVDDIHGEELYNLADKYFNEYWSKHRLVGATCDFGGMGFLEEYNKTFASDGFYDDDFYIPPSVDIGTKIIGFTLLGIIIGGMIGFCIAMRCNKRFHMKVRQSRVMRPYSNSRLFNSSFGGIENAYQDIPVSRGAVA